MHHARGERPQSLGLYDSRPTIGDFLRHMSCRAQTLNPGGQLRTNLASGEHRIFGGREKCRWQAMNSTQCSADRSAVIKSKQVKRARLSLAVNCNHHCSFPCRAGLTGALSLGLISGLRGRRLPDLRLVAGSECNDMIQIESKATRLAGQGKRLSRLHTPCQTSASLFGVSGIYVIQFA